MKEKFNYFDAPSYCNYFSAFITIVIGGRRLGKTWSTRRFLIDEVSHQKKVLEIWRSKQLLEDMYNQMDVGNPYLKMNHAYNWSYGYSKKNSIFGMASEMEFNEDKQIWLPKPNTKIADAMSLSAMGRGIAFAEYDYIFFDEFIRKIYEKKIMKDEFTAFIELLTLINDNREKEGKEKCHVIMFSNADNIYNDYFIGWNLVEEFEKMGFGCKFLPERSIFISHLETPAEEKKIKRASAVGKLMAGTDYEKFFIDNEFINNDFGDVIGSRSLKEYTPVVQIGTIRIYRKKGDNQYYASERIYGKCKKLSESVEDIKFFKQVFGLDLQKLMISGQMKYESYKIKGYLQTMFKFI